MSFLRSQQWGRHGFARSLHAVRDVESHGLSFNGEVHENGFIWSGGRHKGELFLPSSSHVLGDLSTVVLGLNLLDELVVGVVSSVAGVHLVAGTGDGSVDSTKVSGTCTDVNHEGVVNHVKG